MDTATIASITDRTPRNFSNGGEPRTGRRCVGVQNVGDRLDVTFGWWERNGWNGTMEFIVSPINSGRTFKSAAGAARAISSWFAADPVAA